MLSDWERASVARVLPPARPRKLAKVPFVELADGCLQGVVSSGSDLERVYVSSVSAGDFMVACSTNNNRPCGGARDGGCNHVAALIDQAILQFGAARVARYLRVDTGDDVADEESISRAMRRAIPSHDNAAAARVFSRFLRQLSYLDLAPTGAPLPEMHWFPPTRARA